MIPFWNSRWQPNLFEKNNHSCILCLGVEQKHFLDSQLAGWRHMAKASPTADTVRVLTHSVFPSGLMSKEMTFHKKRKAVDRSFLGVCDCFSLSQPAAMSCPQTWCQGNKTFKKTRNCLCITRTICYWPPFSPSTKHRKGKNALFSAWEKFQYLTLPHWWHCNMTCYWSRPVPQTSISPKRRCFPIPVVLFSHNKTISSLHSASHQGWHCQKQDLKSRDMAFLWPNRAGWFEPSQISSAIRITSVSLSSLPPSLLPLSLSFLSPSASFPPFQFTTGWWVQWKMISLKPTGFKTIPFVKPHSRLLDFAPERQSSGPCFQPTFSTQQARCNTPLWPLFTSVFWWN